MSTAKLFDFEHDSSKGTVDELLESILKEEMAYINLLNAESMKLTAFVGENYNFPSRPSSKEILEFTEIVNQVIDTLIFGEWLLLKKLNFVMKLSPVVSHEIEEFYFEENEESNFNYFKGLDGDFDDEE